MRFSEFLSKSSIKIPLEARTKREIVYELIDALPLQMTGQLRQAIFESVMEREEELSTGLGSGIALPHGTAAIGTDAVAAIGFPPDPVDFGSIDGKPVHVVILLVTDEEKPFMNVEALSLVARLLHSSEFREALASCETCEGALRVIREAEGGSAPAP
jgi:mannitol/fructose-specific phosphotransferase system IIA component (Ntr-type)